MPRARTRAIACLAALASASLAAHQAAPEYDVKAAFVLNFVRFVEWPPSRRTPPLRVCVLRTNPFGAQLATLVAGEQWQSGTIEVRVVPELESKLDCHLLYVPEAASSTFASSKKLIDGQPILTVGEHARFLDEGGMIRLFVDQNRVRFSINQRAADDVGLTISSRLLRLAQTVVGAPGGR